MQSTELTERDRQAVLDGFVALVNAPYGDFSGIYQLSRVLNDASTLQRVVATLRDTPQGQRAFAERPLLGTIDLSQLHQLPHSTLGYQYADHMIRNQLTPLPANGTVTDDVSFLKVHTSETHDIWHIVTGCDTDMPGEVKLQAFSVAQFSHDRLFLALLAKNLLKTAMDDVDLAADMMAAIAEGWQMGKQVKPLFGIQWNALWETPLAEIRANLHITPFLESRSLAPVPVA